MKILTGVYDNAEQDGLQILCTLGFIYSIILWFMFDLVAKSPDASENSLQVVYCGAIGH